MQAPRFLIKCGSNIGNADELVKLTLHVELDWEQKMKRKTREPSMGESWDKL
jgi:hypothetical protein